MGIPVDVLNFFLSYFSINRVNMGA
jgi:hypothetical protein